MARNSKIFGMEISYTIGGKPIYAGFYRNTTQHLYLGRKIFFNKHAIKTESSYKRLNNCFPKFEKWGFSSTYTFLDRREDDTGNTAD